MQKDIIAPYDLYDGHLISNHVGVILGFSLTKMCLRTCLTSYHMHFCQTIILQQCPHVLFSLLFTLEKIKVFSTERFTILPIAFLRYFADVAEPVCDACDACRFTAIDMANSCAAIRHFFASRFVPKFLVLLFIQIFNSSCLLHLKS